MRKYVSIFSAIIFVFLFSILISEPSYNGDTAGCSGGGCHDSNPGALSVSTDELKVLVSFPNVSGEKVGGELVNSQGTVVSVVNKTDNNPFTLTAPAAGSYTVNAAYKKPSREWDTGSVEIILNDINQGNSDILPQKLELYNNHPNPFNNETLIRFSLPGQDFVALQIYNINGQLVRDLVNNNLPGGQHSIRWDGKDNKGRIVASGTYLYQLKSSEKQLTKRLMLLK
jgi:hypothetical protein